MLYTLTPTLHKYPPNVSPWQPDITKQIIKPHLDGLIFIFVRHTFRKVTAGFFSRSAELVDLRNVDHVHRAGLARQWTS